MPSTPDQLLARDVANLAACYLGGLFASSLAVSLWVGPGAFMFGAVGAAMASPILVVAVVIFCGFRDRIIRHLLFWCALVPLMVAIMWLTMEWLLTYQYRGLGLSWFLSLRSVWQRVGFAFLSASISSALFWLVHCVMQRRSDDHSRVS
jgi:hypothetical protein